MKKKNMPLFPWTMEFLTMVEREELEMLVSLPNLAVENKMQGSASFRILEKRVQMTQLCEKALLSASCDSRKLLPNSTQMETTDGEKSILCTENFRVLEPVRKPKHWQL